MTALTAEITESIALQDMAFEWTLSPEYTSAKEQNGRRDRFPTVEDRVKTYMGAWYAPPCRDSDKIAFRFVNVTIDGKPENVLLFREVPKVNSSVQRTFVAAKHIRAARAIYLDRQDMEHCDFNHYCVDTKQYMLSTLDRLATNSTTFEEKIPIILQ